MQDWSRIASQELGEKNPLNHSRKPSTDYILLPYYDLVDSKNHGYLKNFELSIQTVMGARAWQNLQKLRLAMRANPGCCTDHLVMALMEFFDLCQVNVVDINALLENVVHCNVAFWPIASSKIFKQSLYRKTKYDRPAEHYSGNNSLGMLEVHCSPSGCNSVPVAGIFISPSSPVKKFRGLTKVRVDGYSY
jgi:hypothetical protein